MEEESEGCMGASTMIRAAVMDDLKDIRALLKEGADAVLNAHGASYDISDLSLILLGDLLNERTPSIYVSALNDEIAGVLILFDMSCFCYIDVVYVKEVYRKSGIGKELLEYVYENASPRWQTIEFCFPADDQIIEDWAKRRGCVVKAPVKWAVKTVDRI